MTTPRTIARPPAVGGSIPQLIFGDLWEYDPAPETADPKLKPKYDLFIGGKFVAPKSGKYFESVNPATEEVLAEIALAGPADVDAAYHAAQKAFTPWSKLPGAERGKYLYRIARLIQDRAREFAVLQALLTRPGAILSRGDLERHIYGWNEEVESNAIEFLIHAIRKKLGALAIRNVRGVGWMVDRPS